VRPFDRFRSSSLSILLSTTLLLFVLGTSASADICESVTRPSPSCILDVLHPPFAPTATVGDHDGASLTYDTVVEKWLSDTRLAFAATCDHDQNAATPAVDCLIVPKYYGSTFCDQTGPETTHSYHWTYCGFNTPEEQISTNVCLVTDQLSQVGMALAMGTGTSSTTKFDQWVNTIEWIARATDPRVPRWNLKVRLATTPATIEAVNDDDASDGTARVVIALFTAAASPAFTPTQQSRYRQLASTIASGFRSDFKNELQSTRLGPIRYWLASGFQTGMSGYPLLSPNHGTFSWAGYYGDVVIALLAAHRGASSNNAEYLEIARDTVKAYLLASDYVNTFAVPPTAFRWSNLDPDIPSESAVTCTYTCGKECGNAYTWDPFDAPRAVSICKAEYYAGVAGVDLGSSLSSYCAAWLSSGGAPAGSYALQYNVKGEVCSDVRGGFKENGLGAALNFAFGRDALCGRLAEAFGHLWSTATPPRVDACSTNCMGIYDHTFAIVSFGSAIGRDYAAFAGNPPTNLLATATSPSSVSLTWTAVPAAVGYRVERRTSLSSPVVTTDVATNSYNDTTVAPSTAYLYHVRTRTSDGVSGPSNSDIATTFSFSDATLTQGVTPIRALHFNEVRTAINAVRAIADQPVAGTSVAVGVAIQVSDLTALRDAIGAAREALGISSSTWCQPSIISGATLVRACDIEDLRTAVR
jgi:hypothetical protein